MQPASTRHHNVTIRNQLKAQAVNRAAIEDVLADGTKRYISTGVAMLMTYQDASKRCFALHAKRGDIPANLISFVKGCLTEKGWDFLSGGMVSKGLWEGTFVRIN